MIEGPQAAKDGKTGADCPYNPNGGPAERVLARMWVRGFARARNVLAKQDRATQAD
jgi:hypothetical protein